TFDYEILSERLRESAFLLNNLKVELIDEREDIEEEYEYPDGLQSFINYLNEDKETLHDVVSIDGKQAGFEVDFAFQFNDGFTESMLSFVNHVRTNDGGTHEAGARAAVTRTINDYARRNEFLKEKDK